MHVTTEPPQMTSRNLRKAPFQDHFKIKEYTNRPFIKTRFLSNCRHLPPCSAKNSECLAHEWHKNYSAHFTEYLGGMGCRICSKVMGIGEDECHWKQLKVRGGQRACLIGTQKAKKQATIAANHSMKRSVARRPKANTAGKLWTDNDFDTCGFGECLVFILIIELLRCSHKSHFKQVSIVKALSWPPLPVLSQSDSSGPGVRTGRWRFSPMRAMTTTEPLWPPSMGACLWIWRTLMLLPDETQRILAPCLDWRIDYEYESWKSSLIKSSPWCSGFGRSCTRWKARKKRNRNRRRMWNKRVQKKQDAQG